jgi:probable HAF family extracellular repeat protein
MGVKIMFVKHSAGLLALAVMLPLSANAAGTSYTVTDLGALGGTFSQPFALNKAGTVAGGATLANGAQHAVLWSQGGVADLGTFGGPNSTAFGVNDKTVASGAAETKNADPNGEDFCGFGTHLSCLPFVSHSGSHMKKLPTLGGNNGVGLRNNRSGTVAGYAETSMPDASCPAPQVLQFLPAVWTRSEVAALSTVGGDVRARRSIPIHFSAFRRFMPCYGKTARRPTSGTSAEIPAQRSGISPGL